EADPRVDRAAALRDENARLAANLAALRAATSAASGDPQRKRRPRREFGADLLTVFADGTGGPDSYPKLRMELMLLAGEMADKYGVSALEGRLSPDTLEEVFVGMREAGKPPLSETEQASLNAALANYRSDWNAWLARNASSMSLERRADLFEIQARARDSLFASVPPDALNAMRTAMDGLDDADVYSDSGYISGTAEKVGGRLARAWCNDFGLEKSEAAALLPIAAQYIRDQDAHEEWQAPQEATGTYGLRDELSRLPAMVQAQKRIREVARLTDAQAKKLAEWAKIYTVTINDGTVDYMEEEEGE
ncbi:MAG: hypothetical protein FD180_4446, partial [Planctomycetota bacterium]